MDVSVLRYFENIWRPEDGSDIPKAARPIENAKP